MSDTTDYLTEGVGRTTESDQGAAPAETRPRRRAAGLSGMLLPELQALATSLGISGVGRMRKSDLVSAIQSRQSGNGTPTAGGQAAGPAAGGAVVVASGAPSGSWSCPGVDP